jgi:hypothetical protein
MSRVSFAFWHSKTDGIAINWAFEHIETHERHYTDDRTMIYLYWWFFIEIFENDNSPSLDTLSAQYMSDQTINVEYFSLVAAGGGQNVCIHVEKARKRSDVYNIWCNVSQFGGVVLRCMSLLWLFSFILSSQLGSVVDTGSRMGRPFSPSILQH